MSAVELSRWDMSAMVDMRWEYKSDTERPNVTGLVVMACDTASQKLQERDSVDWSTHTTHNNKLCEVMGRTMQKVARGHQAESARGY